MVEAWEYPTTEAEALSLIEEIQLRCVRHWAILNEDPGLADLALDLGLGQKSLPVVIKATEIIRQRGSVTPLDLANILLLFDRTMTPPFASIGDGRLIPEPDFSRVTWEES